MVILILRIRISAKVSDPALSVLRKDTGSGPVNHRLQPHPFKITDSLSDYPLKSQHIPDIYHRLLR